MFSVKNYDNYLVVKIFKIKFKGTNLARICLHMVYVNSLEQEAEQGTVH